MEDRMRSSNKYLISFQKKNIDNEREVPLGEIAPKMFPKSNKGLNIQTEGAY